MGSQDCPVAKKETAQAALADPDLAQLQEP